MRIFLGLIFICSGAAFGNTDIDYIKNKVLRPFYYGDEKQPGAIKKVEDYAVASYETADQYISAAYLTMKTAFEGGLAGSTADLKDAYSRASSCRAQMNLIYTLFRPHIEAESRLDTRQAIEGYRRQNISADTFNVLSDSALQVQRLHHDCYEFLLRVRDASFEFDTHSKGTANTLCKIFEEVRYEGLNVTKDVVIRPEYKIDNDFKWPDVQINYASDLGCSSQGYQVPSPPPNGESSKPVADCRSGFFLSTNGARYQSKFMHARQNIRTASMAGTAALTSCASCVAYLQESIAFMPASASAVAIPAAVALFVEMSISYYEMEQRRKAIKDLDNFVDEAEDKLEAAFSKVVKADEFNEKRLAFCSEKEAEFQQFKASSILKIEANDHILKINDFFRKADASIGWYNDLFLFATSGQAGSRLIDDLAKAKITEKREQLYSILDGSKARIFLAANKSDTQKLQSQIASSCLTGASKPEKVRKFRTAVRKFSALCDAQTAMTKVSTDYLNYEDGSKSDIRCHYSGFEPAAKLQVRINSDASLMLIALQGDREISRVDSVTSESLFEQELYCISDSQIEFGISSQLRLKAETIPLNHKVDVIGLKLEDFQSHMLGVKKLNDSARSAITACSRILGTSAAAQPLNSCVNGI